MDSRAHYDLDSDTLSTILILMVSVMLKWRLFGFILRGFGNISATKNTEMINDSKFIIKMHIWIFIIS